MMNKEILNQVQDKEDYPVRITFEVICDSNTDMQEGETIKERIESYIDNCADAMDDSMRHWGDHHNDIEPMKVEVWDEDGNQMDITDDILSEINPASIPELLKKSLKDIKKYIIALNKNVPELMVEPYHLPSMTKIDYGKNLHTYYPEYGDPHYWLYPEGVEEKIEDDKLYKVWYSSNDASDPADSTIWNYVKYICYIPIEKDDLRKELENIMKLV